VIESPLLRSARSRPPPSLPQSWLGCVSCLIHHCRYCEVVSFPDFLGADPAPLPRLLPPPLLLHHRHHHHLLLLLPLHLLPLPLRRLLQPVPEPLPFFLLLGEWCHDDCVAYQTSDDCCCSSVPPTLTSTKLPRLPVQSPTPYRSVSRPSEPVHCSSATSPISASSVDVLARRIPSCCMQSPEGN
jgi:hypothetical protein